MRESVFGRTLLVSGPEELLAERAVRERVELARAENPTAEVHRVDAVALEGHQLAEITGGSLFASQSITVISDISGISADLSDALLAVALDPGPDLALVLTHPGGVKGKGMLDKLKKAKVETIQVAAIKAWDVPGFVLAEAKARGVRLAQPAAQALVGAVGTDLRALVAAVDQLSSDAEGAGIDEAFIGRYFAGRAEVTSFAVADAVLSGNARLALERLRWALETGVAPVLVTSAMANALRSLGKYLDAKTARVGDYDMARTIGVPPWKVKDIAKVARSWTPGAVVASMQAVARADADVKGAASNADYALERMVLSALNHRR